MKSAADSNTCFPQRARRAIPTIQPRSRPVLLARQFLHYNDQNAVSDAPAGPAAFRSPLEAFLIFFLPLAHPSLRLTMDASQRQAASGSGCCQHLQLLSKHICAVAQPIHLLDAGDPGTRREKARDGGAGDRRVIFDKESCMTVAVRTKHENSARRSRSVFDWCGEAH